MSVGQWDEARRGEARRDKVRRVRREERLIKRKKIIKVCLCKARSNVFAIRAS